MKISVLTYLFSRYPLEKCFAIASQYGYDGIELWGARPHAYPYDMDEARVTEVLRFKDRYGLEISMYTPELLAYPYNLTSQDKNEREETVEYLKTALDVAGKIGTPRMQVTTGHAGYGTDREKNWQNLYEGMRTLADHAEQAGVDIIVEALTPQESNMVICCDDIVELLRRVKSPRVKGMIDMVTPVAYHESFESYFDKLGEAMDYIHCVDSDGSTYDHLP
jgi:protein FrlC